MEEGRFIMNKKCIVFGGVQLFFFLVVVCIFVSYEKKEQEVETFQQANSVLFELINGEYEELDHFKEEHTEQISKVEEDREILKTEVKNIEDEMNSLQEERDLWETRIAEIDK